MSEAIERARAAIARNDSEWRNPDDAWFAPMVLEMAETVQRLALWEVQYVAVNDVRPQPRSLSVPITVDRAELARIVEREVARSFPVGKVRKLKSKPTREQTRFVRGWGEITLDQAAEAMRKLVDDVGIVRTQRDQADHENALLRVERDQLRAALDKINSLAKGGNEE